jgi:thiol-disulfide isomerase/thioredoxin
MNAADKKTNPTMQLTRRTVLALPLAAAALQGATLPRPAEPLKIPRPGGLGPVDPTAYKGKVVALLFLLTTCPHCKAFSKALETVSKELGPLGFQVLGAAINDNTGRLVTAFAQETGATFPIGYVKQEVSNDYLQIPSMQTMYMPQLVLIDRKGMIRYHHPGQDEKFYGNQEANLRAEVKLLLAEKGGAGVPAPKGAAKVAGKKS